MDLYPSQELDENYQVIQRGEVYKHANNLQLDHFLTAILVLALALVVGLGVGHFLGKFHSLIYLPYFQDTGLTLSVMTNIPPTLLGLGPDPLDGPHFGLGPNPEAFLDQNGEGMSPSGRMSKDDTSQFSPNEIKEDEFLDGFKSVEDFDVNPEKTSQFTEQLQKPTKEPGSFSFLDSLRNIFIRLGTKFGYIKKSPQPVNVKVLEFQCMTADDQPILVDGHPVLVQEPKDCHRYYVSCQDSSHTTTSSTMIRSH